MIVVASSTGLPGGTVERFGTAQPCCESVRGKAYLDAARNTVVEVADFGLGGQVEDQVGKKLKADFAHEIGYRSHARIILCNVQKMVSAV